MKIHPFLTIGLTTLMSCSTSESTPVPSEASANPASSPPPTDAGTGCAFPDVSGTLQDAGAPCPSSCIHVVGKRFNEPLNCIDGFVGCMTCRRPEGCGGGPEANVCYRHTTTGQIVRITSAAAANSATPEDWIRCDDEDDRKFLLADCK